MLSFFFTKVEKVDLGREDSLQLGHKLPGSKVSMSVRHDT